uniref:Ion_trans domain-containing protein n=1 Tax=Macrostomum lignano TaxID=282301 RepID=A0A1I8F9K8_9PLAT
ILTAPKDWNVVMYNGINSNGGVGSLVGILVAFYFVILFICGNYILLNVFLAIAEKKDGEGGEQADGAGEGGQGGDGDGGDDGKNPDGIVGENSRAASGMERSIRLDLGGDDDDIDQPEGDGDGGDDSEAEETPVTTARPRRLSELKHQREKASSLFVFSSTNRFRVLCHRICNHSYFGSVVLVCILVSSAMLAAEEPVNSENPRNKVTAYGLVLHDGSFCRQAFNLLDILVVLTSLASFFLELLYMSIDCKIRGPVAPYNNRRPNGAVYVGFHHRDRLLYGHIFALAFDNCHFQARKGEQEYRNCE